MGNALTEQRVSCRKCRYLFVVRVPPVEDWRVEAQCPVCEAWASFTIADTPEEPTRTEPEELDQAVQWLGEQLWQPLNEHRDHPAIAWLDRVGNGVFEDDHSEQGWLIPGRVYRFTRGGEAAYIWQKEGSWFVRGWHPMRSRHKPPELADRFTNSPPVRCSRIRQNSGAAGPNSGEFGYQELAADLRNGQLAENFSFEAALDCLVQKG